MLLGVGSGEDLEVLLAALGYELVCGVVARSGRVGHGGLEEGGGELARHEHIPALALHITRAILTCANNELKLMTSSQSGYLQGD